ncbi:MAG: bifunctional adenosylcobinamide kinase/adenosylcobinamide-phosphate guanylyltransferase [Oscillospiraceae bacterium]|nr:bifunctional adenosylcobinamide kinase/adenosylcobinamide-phosphate guanylyltransferase [Oscillospiraceae bacterium]
MTVLVSGGSKCGKSRYAEDIISKSGIDKKYYIATMQPFGEEAHLAIERHRKMREGKGFLTLEQYTDIEKAEISLQSAVLIECMGNLCANEMFSDSAVEDPVSKIVSGIKKLSERAGLLVIVTNEVFSDGIEYESGTMEYIKAMGEINSRISAFADVVTECVYGIPVAVKGDV